jgi:leucyl-tRNA synthetase
MRLPVVIYTEGSNDCRDLMFLSQSDWMDMVFIVRILHLKLAGTYGHAQITENYYAQLQKIGAMFDWENRDVYTDYYRWTQWLFTQMFKHGLAYRDKASVNWCPSCKTVLADEQVIDSECERCGNIVEKRLLEQWFFRITAYAGKLLENSLSLDWSEKVKVAQKNWIGKKEGINYHMRYLLRKIRTWAT